VTSSLVLVLSLFLLQDEKPAPKIELKGFLKVEGISFKQGEKTKYSGDTYILRLAFTDEKGAAFQPTPTLNFVVYNDKEPYGKAQRLVTKDSWKVDAEKISKDNVADKTIAHDKKTGELLVAFVRADPGFQPRIDLTLEIRGTGTWTWKGIVEESRFEETAKGPDKPAKK
jgi:hypothetical protein